MQHDELELILSKNPHRCPFW